MFVYKYIGFIVTIIFINLFSSETNIISDYNFTNQEYNYKQVKNFVKSFPDNKLKSEQIWFLFYFSRYFEINPVIILARMECETSLISNPPGLPSYIWLEHRCMGYGLYEHKKVKGKKYYRYGFYDVQVYMAIMSLRKYFDRWQSGKKVFIKCINKKIEPVNATNYSLLLYCPFYYDHSTYGYEQGGNKGFEKVFESFNDIIKKYE